MDKLHCILSYIKYLICSRHFRGDGVHSPFIFRLINAVFREENAYYTYYKLEKIRELLLNDRREIFVEDYGTGNTAQRKISEIARKSLKNKKYSQLLFRLVNNANPLTILELGTSLGLTTMYLASVNSKSRCVTIEGSPEIHEKATELFRQHNYTNIESCCGNIDDILPKLLEDISTLDFVFFDANHQKEPTLNYFYQCLNKIGPQSIFVFDDIYWSKEMTDAWKQIIQDSRVKVSLDIFSMGIVFFNEELQKENYRLRF